MGSQNFPLISGLDPIGMALMKELIQRKIPVKMANRSGLARTPAEVEILTLNAADSTTVRKIFQKDAVVYNCTSMPNNCWQDLLPKIHRGIIEGVKET